MANIVLSRTSGSSGAAVVRAVDRIIDVRNWQSQSREARIIELRDLYQSNQYSVNASDVSTAIIGQHINVLA